MNEVFADTSGWASFFIRTEPHFSTANEWMRAWRTGGVRVVTTNYVISELVALFTSPMRVPRSQQIRLIDSIRNATWVDIVHLDADMEFEAWTLLKNRPDKIWSLVDCSSFVVMARRGITHALTTDHHFEQAGFQRFLK
jgi:predicted nucleic acid-binding protein